VARKRKQLLLLFAVDEGCSSMKSIMYGDGHRLFSEDCESLNKGGWLVEGVIHYKFVELQEQQDRREENVRKSSRSSSASSASSSVAKSLFCDPFVVQYLARQCSDNDDYLDFAKGQELARRSVVFMAINDVQATSYSEENKESVKNNLGAHWSLLVVRQRFTADAGAADAADSASPREW
jgi:hypothetical protein